MSILWLQRLLDAVAGLLLAGILLVTAARVVARYVLGEAMPWSEELTRLLFVWLVLIGAARCAHLQVDIVSHALAPRARRRLEIAVAVISVGLLGLLMWKGLGLIELTAYDRYTALDLSLQYLYWSLIVGGGFWIVTIVISALRPAKKPEVPEI